MNNAILVSGVQPSESVIQVSMPVPFPTQLVTNDGRGFPVLQSRFSSSIRFPQQWVCVLPTLRTLPPLNTFTCGNQKTAFEICFGTDLKKPPKTGFEICSRTDLKKTPFFQFPSLSTMSNHFYWFLFKISSCKLNQI